jgi:hypothetical protein
MACAVPTTVSSGNQQNNDQVTRLILLGITGGGMYHFLILPCLKYQTLLTLSSRLPEDSKQKSLSLSILYPLDVGVTEFNFEV